MKDTYRHKGLRKRLIDSLREKGIKDERVLAAMEVLPRHFFLDTTFDSWAYQDKAFPIGNDQTISQPFTVAFQTQLLEIKKREKVLEVGTGSGYQAAILASMGARVFTIERQEALHLNAKKRLDAMGFKGIRHYFRDGYKGLPEFVPFDKIIVTAGATSVPEALLKQLKPGGMMVIPVGKKVQKMLRIIKISDTEFQEEDWGDFRFVPFLSGVERKEV